MNAISGPLFSHQQPLAENPNIYESINVRWPQLFYEKHKMRNMLMNAQLSKKNEALKMRGLRRILLQRATNNEDEFVD